MYKFTQLEKKMTSEELEKFCKKITEEYANSAAQFARSYFCKKYEITISCFYKILEKSVINNLVEDITVQKMIKKAIENQNAHKNGAGASSIIKYAKMYTKRYKYIAETMKVNDIKELAEDFANNPNISKIQFALSYGVNSKVVDYCLKRAIIQNIVDDFTVKEIETRSIANATTNNIDMIKNYFANLKRIREENKKEIALK